MATDTSKALKSFQDDFLTSALKANPNDLIRATQVTSVYSQLLLTTFMIVEPVVAGWKLKMFDSRADALLLRSLALVVNHANKEERPLADLDLLETCFNRATQRCPSALNHMSAPDWDQARQTRDHRSAGVAAPASRHRTSDMGQPGTNQESTGDPSDDSVLNPSTAKLMEQARDQYGVDELGDTLEDAPKLVNFHDLDRATQIAIDTITKSIANGQPDAIERYCGSTVLTGYIVGRAMLQTTNGALHFSNPLTEAENAEVLIHKATTPAADPYTEVLDATGLLFAQLQQEMASRSGPLAALGKQVRDRLTGGSAAAGMVLAIAEYDLHVADE